MAKSIKEGLMRRKIGGKMYYGSDYGKSKEELQKVGKAHKHFLRNHPKYKKLSYRVVKLTQDEIMYIESHGFRKGLKYLLFISDK